MRRREVIGILGGAAASALLVAARARAQQNERMRRIGVLMNLAAEDPETKTRLAAFEQVLQHLGWTIGQNVRIDDRAAGGNTDRLRSYAAELVALAPDVILAQSSTAVALLLQATRSVPIVFADISDPVGAGFVDSLARPGGNATGFMLLEYSLSGKWLEFLKEIVPRLTRAAVLRDPANPAATAQFGSIQAMAPSLGVEVSPVSVRDAGEIERAVEAIARTANGGLIVTPSASVSVYHDLIIALAARHKLPAIYSFRSLVTRGGLISYGPDTVDQFRNAAGYVDRILKGEKPADLPVQAPTKFELVVNLKTAKALGLDVPTAVLARADEVIE
jgi:putative tryptophan/tyrosine transport system substrate-binding protein